MKENKSTSAPEKQAELVKPAQDNKPTTLKGLLNSASIQEQIAKALPEHMKAERMIRVATTALTKTPKLQECEQSSFFKCLLELSSFGLEPDGRNAHLIPFRNNQRGVVECQLIIDYKGLVALVLRSGEVSNIHCDVVCENDEFEENLGQILVHKINRREKRGEVFAAYSRVMLKDGSVSCCVMGKDEIDAIRARSKAKNSGPWVSDYNEMAKKTVFRRHSKTLPLSVELTKAIEHDDDQFVNSMRNATPKKAAPQFELTTASTEGGAE